MPVRTRPGLLLRFGCSLAALAIGFLPLLLLRIVGPARRPLPAEVQRGGPFRGAGRLAETVWLANWPLHGVRLLARGELDSTPGPELAVVGVDRVLFLDDSGRVKAQTRLPVGQSFRDTVRLYQPDRGAPCQYVTAGVWDGQVTLRGHDGRVRWRHATDSGVDGIAAGDLEGQGHDAILVSYNGGGGVERLDDTGRSLWRAPAANAWHIAVLRDGDRRLVVHSNAEGKVVALDAAGQPPSPRRGPVSPSYLSEFAVCPFPRSDSPECVVVAERHTLQFLAMNGQGGAATSVPYGSHPRGLAAAWVRFWPDRAANLAVAVRLDDDSFLPASHVLTYVLDAVGRVFYATSTEGAGPALAVVPRPDGRGERLLIGAMGKVIALSAPVSR